MVVRKFQTANVTFEIIEGHGNGAIIRFSISVHCNYVYLAPFLMYYHLFPNI